MGILASLPETDHQDWPWNKEVPSTLYTDENINWPKISIVTPSYNQGKFIEETIRSILLQNYPNLEYIIMDGGSDDETKEIIEKYSPYFHYWTSGKDDGQSDALIKGFEKASGEIFNWINSDDILHPNALYHIAITFLKHPELSFVHGKNGIISIDSKLIGYMPHPEDKLETRYLCEMPYGQQACFYKSDIYFQSGGINIALKFSMDYELFAKMHLLDIKSKQIHELIGSYRVHPETKTSNLEEVMRIENGNTFTTVLLSTGDILKADFFKQLGFVPYKLYETKGNISNTLIRAAVLLYLKKNIWYYYNQMHIKTALKMAYKLILMEPKNIFNVHYLKIIKDGAIKILQSGWSR